MSLQELTEQLRSRLGQPYTIRLAEADVFTDEEGWGYKALVGDETDLHGPNTFLLAKPGDRVLMHLNLGTKFRTHGLKTWSVKDTRGSETIGHIFGAVLKDAKFVARSYGNVLARVLNEKTVHAWVDGKLVASSPPSQIPAHGTPIKYNPHIPPSTSPDPTAGGHYAFVRQDERGQWTIPVASADTVFLTPDWKLLAVGVKDMQGLTKTDPDKEHQIVTKFMQHLQKKGQVNKLQTVADTYKAYLQGKSFER